MTTNAKSRSATVELRTLSVDDEDRLRTLVPGVLARAPRTGKDPGTRILLRRTMGLLADPDGNGQTDASRKPASCPGEDAPMVRAVWVAWTVSFGFVGQ